jgi:hypothetical protein
MCKDGNREQMNSHIFAVHYNLIRHVTLVV